MNTVSSSSSFSASASSNRGMSGLVSGLDTEGWVEQMLSGTQSKIDKQYQEKTEIEWKQEMYREMITDINGFYSKYFDYLSDTNLTSSSFYNAMMAATSSSAFKVTAGSNAATGNTSVVVQQLASATKVSSGGKVSGDFELKFNTDALNKKVVFEVGTSEVTVDLAGATTQQDIVDKINTAMSGRSMSAAIEDGKILLKGEFRVSGKSDGMGLNVLGLAAGSKSFQNKDGDYVMKLDNADPNVKFKMQVSLDGGTQQTLEFGYDEITNASGDIDKALFTSALQSKLDRAFGVVGSVHTVTVDSTADGFKLSVKDSSGADDTGRQIAVYGDKAVTDLFGIENGQSNKIATGLKLKDLNLGIELQGDEFEVEINGTKIKLSGDDTLSAALTKINRSDAGVRITYAPLEDKFSIESTKSGAGHDITLHDVQGNFLSAILGDSAATMERVGSKQLTTGTVEGGTLEAAIPNDFKEGKMTFQVNGKSYSISVPRRTDNAGNPIVYSESQIVKAVNEQLQNYFGYEGNDQAIELVKNGGTFELKVRDGSAVSFAPRADGEEYNAADLGQLFGFRSATTGATNVANKDTTLGELGIVAAGDPLENTKLEDLTGEPGSPIEGLKYNADTGRLEADSSITGSANFTNAMSQKLFGADISDFQFGAAGDTVNSHLDQTGQNARVEINGVVTERDSNKFSVNGLNFELMAESAKDASGAYIEETVNTTRDTDKIVEGIKSFIKDYNELIGKLNDKIGEKATYRDYPPLTDAQKKEMSEKEIEAWEKKAKEGLLRNDSTVSSFLSSMRIALYQKPEGCAFALFDLGIGTATYTEKGKLVIEDEALLRQRIESNPEDIQRLFTESNIVTDANGNQVETGKGLAAQLKYLINKTASTSSGSRGALVQMAGYSGKASDKDNNMTKQLTKINDRIKDLKKKYEAERARYWRQFNAMEKALSSMNQQSSWLMSQFA